MPALDQSEHLSSVSPSRLERLLGCPLRIAFEQARSGIGVPTSSPWALVGIAVHRAIEFCLAEPPLDLSEAWGRACDELSAKGIDPRVAPNARRAVLRLERRLPALLAYLDSRQPTELFREHRLTSADGTINGTVDLLVLGPRPAIVDHKTGAVLDEEGMTRSAYEHQLALYAWLAKDSLGVEVEEAALFSLREGLIEVDVGPNARQPIVAAALEAMDSFNAHAPGPQPATPSDESCRSCPFVGHCDPAWDALGDGTVEHLGWGDAVQGVVRGQVVVAAGGRAAVRLDVRSGTVEAVLVMSDVPGDVAGQLAENDELRAWGLGRRSDEPVALTWRDGSSQLVPQ